MHTCDHDLCPVEKLLSSLKEAGYKMTLPRRQIVEILVDNTDRFLNAETILEKVKALNAQVNLTTIYRNLDTLVDVGAVHKLYFENQVAYYKLSCDEKHHHHMICTHCGKMTVLNYCPLEALNKVAKSDEFVIEAHNLEVFGSCKACAARKNKKQ